MNFPRSRADLESAARARLLMWRGLAVYAVIYATLLVVLARQFILPAFGDGQ